MPIARPFAQNLGPLIPGTEQIGNLAIGYPLDGFGSTDLKWWNGPDEELGYIIAHENPHGQPGADGTVAYVEFFISSELSDESFVSLSETISDQFFADGASAKAWLNSNGYWTSWEDSSPVLVAELDAADALSYPGTGNIWTDLENFNDGTLLDGSGVITWGNTPGGMIAGGTFDLSGGQGTRIEFSDTGDLSLGTASFKSYILWFRSNTILSGSLKATIMNKMSSDNQYNGFLISWDSTNKIQLITGGTNFTKQYSSKSSFIKNKWYMLSFICKISNEPHSTKIYMNTSLEIQGSHGSDTINDNQPLYLGNYGSGVQNSVALSGGIGEFYVYERELLSSDISLIFNLTKSRFGY